MTDENQDEPSVETQTTPDSVNKEIHESEDKITLTWKSKRGTGTRDQDEFDVKVKGDTPEDVIRDMIEMMDGVASDQGGLMGSARAMQPRADIEEDNE